MMADRKAQRSKILELLTAARGEWVPLSKILDLRIGQYNARIFELRREGFKIENKTGDIGGTQRSWFRLVSSPAAQPPQPGTGSESASLFPPKQIHRDE